MGSLFNLLFSPFHIFLEDMLSVGGGGDDSEGMQKSKEQAKPPL